MPKHRAGVALHEASQDHVVLGGANDAVKRERTVRLVGDDIEVALADLSQAFELSNHK